MPLELLIHLAIGVAAWLIAAHFFSNKPIKVLLTVIIAQLTYAIIHYPIAAESARGLHQRLEFSHYLFLMPFRLAISSASAFLLFLISRKTELIFTKYFGACLLIASLVGAYLRYQPHATRPNSRFVNCDSGATRKRRQQPSIQPISSINTLKARINSRVSRLPAQSFHAMGRRDLNPIFFQELPDAPPRNFPSLQNYQSQPTHSEKQSRQLSSVDGIARCHVENI